MSRSYEKRKAIIKNNKGIELLKGKRSRLSPGMKKKRDALIKKAVAAE